MSLHHVSSVVIPGQVISSESGFLRGHGTYVEQCGGEPRLVASVVGVVERVNQLLSVHPMSMFVGHVGDVVVGRITAVHPQRWTVSLVESQPLTATLALTGVFVSGGAQRMKTAQDARDMRILLDQGDLVSAEINSIQQDGTIQLHTRSIRYGKLENGTLVIVPPALIARRKNHILVLCGLMVLLGTNGYIWIQRPLLENEANFNGDNHPSEDALSNASVPMAEQYEQLKLHHANTPVLPDERQAIARMRNSIECLRMTHVMVTPENIQTIFQESQTMGISLSAMLHPDNVIALTARLRERNNI